MQDPKLITIERVVAFVVAPLVTAASGLLSAKALQLGFHVTPDEVKLAFTTGGLTAGAACWKWLHGRQVYERVEADVRASGLSPFATSLIHTTLKDLEGLAESAAQRTADTLTERLGEPHKVSAATSGSPPEGDIPPAADPAPAGQVAEQADGGAASGS